MRTIQFKISDLNSYIMETIILQKLRSMDNFFDFSDLHVHHPQFGCGIHTMVRELSVYASCSQLLPGEFGGL